MRHTTVHHQMRQTDSGIVPVVQHTRQLEEKPEREKFEKPDWAKKYEKPEWAQREIGKNEWFVYEGKTLKAAQSTKTGALKFMEDDVGNKRVLIHSEKEAVKYEKSFNKEKKEWQKPKANFLLMGYNYDEMRRKIKRDMQYEGVLNYRITYSDSKKSFYMIDNKDRDYGYFDLSPDEFMRDTEEQAVASIMRPHHIG